jgi:hypothetical protein
MKSVTGALDHDAAVSGHSVGEQLVVARQSDLHFIGLLFPQLGRTLEIGEQERHRSGRQRHCANGGGSKVWVLTENAMFEIDEFLTGFDAQLIHEKASRPLIGAECVGLSAAAV